MKNYIVKVTKPLGKILKVEIEAKRKKEIIEKLSINFGLGIAPISNRDIILKSDLPKHEQFFYYEKTSDNFLHF